MHSDNQKEEKVRPLAWVSLYTALGAGIILTAYFVFYPAFSSPSSRLYFGSLGYPSVMRALEKPISVKTATVTVRDFTQAVTASGNIRYLNEIPVKCEIPGIVTEIAIARGQKVAKGDLLLKLNTGGYNTKIAGLNLELRKTVLSHARDDLTREQQAFNDGAISQSQLNEFVQRMEKAQIEYEKALENHAASLRTRTESVLAGSTPARGDSLTSPHEVELRAITDGVVFKTGATTGENHVNPSAALLTLGDQLVFRAALDQRYAGTVTKGNTCKVFLRAYPGTPFDGEIIRIDPIVTADGGSRQSVAIPYTFPAWIAIRRPESELQPLLPGMNGYCSVSKTLTATAIPESAIMRYSGRTGIVMVANENDEIDITQVSYIAADNGWVAISSGLTEGQSVIVEGQAALEQGDKVVRDES